MSYTRDMHTSIGPFMNLMGRQGRTGDEYKRFYFQSPPPSRNLESEWLWWLWGKLCEDHHFPFKLYFSVSTLISFTSCSCGTYCPETRWEWKMNLRLHIVCQCVFVELRIQSSEAKTITFQLLQCFKSMILLILLKLLASTANSIWKCK